MNRRDFFTLIAAAPIAALARGDRANHDHGHEWRQWLRVVELRRVEVVGRRYARGWPSAW